MNDRCCQCHTILTSEDKYHYGANCESCECISNGRTMSSTTQSSQPTGDGVQSATAYVGCGISLKPFEVYACTDCLNFWLMSYLNGLMGEDDG